MILKSSYLVNKHTLKSHYINSIGGLQRKSNQIYYDNQIYKLLYWRLLTNHYIKFDFTTYIYIKFDFPFLTGIVDLFNAILIEFYWLILIILIIITLTHIYIYFCVYI